jgi:hypothetical protein
MLSLRTHGGEPDVLKAVSCEGFSMLAIESIHHVV